MATLLFGVVKYKTPEYLSKKLDGWTAKGTIALKGPYHYTFLNTEPHHSKGISVIVQQSAGLICHLLRNQVSHNTYKSKVEISFLTFHKTFVIFVRLNTFLSF